jgi:hypothetical protein
MLALVSRAWRMVFTLSGIVAFSNISKTARRCDVLDMPAFCKVSKASLCFEFVTMSDPYQKCNRVATIIKLNPATCNPSAPAGGSRHRTREVALLKGASGSCRRGSTEKIMLTDSIHAIIPHLNQSAIFVGVVVGFLNV